MQNEVEGVVVVVQCLVELLRNLPKCLSWRGRWGK